MHLKTQSDFSVGVGVVDSHQAGAPFVREHGRAFVDSLGVIPEFFVKARTLTDCAVNLLAFLGRVERKDIRLGGAGQNT